MNVIVQKHLNHELVSLRHLINDKEGTVSSDAVSLFRIALR